MAEDQARSDLDQTDVDGGYDRVPVDAEALRRAPYLHRVGKLLGRGDHQQPARVVRQLVDTLPEALLDTPRYLRRAVQPDSNGELRRRHAARELEQCQWIAVRLRDDAVTDTVIEIALDRADEQLPRGLVAEPAHLELR